MKDHSDRLAPLMAARVPREVAEKLKQRIRGMTPEEFEALLSDYIADDTDDLAQLCPRCEEAGCAGAHDPRDCSAPRPWKCFCEARMAGECLCGAWDDVR